MGQNSEGGFFQGLVKTGQRAMRVVAVGTLLSGAPEAMKALDVLNFDAISFSTANAAEITPQYRKDFAKFLSEQWKENPSTKAAYNKVKERKSPKEIVPLGGWSKYSSLKIIAELQFCFERMGNEIVVEANVKHTNGTKDSHRIPFKN